MILFLIIFSLLILVVVSAIFVELHTFIFKIKGILSFKWFQHKNAQHNWLVILAFLSVFMGLLSFAWLFYIKDFLLVMQKGATMATWGQVGDFIGGIGGTLFSLSGFVLLYLSFASQRESSEKQQIEGRFFELIKLHRENTLEMEYLDPYLSKNSQGTSAGEEKGRVVFKRIYYQIIMALDITAMFINEFENDPEKIYTEKARATLLNNENVVQRRVSIVELAKIDVAYSLVFNGVPKDSEAALKRQLLKFYQQDFIDPLLSLFMLLPSRGSDLFQGMQDIITSKNLLTALIKELKNDSEISTIGERMTTKFNKNEKFEFLFEVTEHLGNFTKFFGGHQYKLGHYFRNFFQTVTYIDRSDALSYEEKYYYIKTLRSQLSTYEQYIFVVNSLSHLGLVWEYGYVGRNDVNRHLITKYNLIKNISALSLFESLNVESYYPNVSFEFEDKPEGRKHLIKNYY